MLDTGIPHHFPLWLRLLDLKWASTMIGPTAQVPAPRSERFTKLCKVRAGQKCHKMQPLAMPSSEPDMGTPLKFPYFCCWKSLIVVGEIHYFPEFIPQHTHHMSEILGRRTAGRPSRSPGSDSSQCLGRDVCGIFFKKTMGRYGK